MFLKRESIFILRGFGKYCRTLVTEAKNKEIQTTEKPKKKKRESVSKEVLDYFGKDDVLKSFPEILQRKKMRAPEAMYNTSEKTAEFITSVLKKDLSPSQTLLEVHPGVGHISKRLISETQNDIFLFEPEEKFHEGLSNIINNESNKERNIVLKPFDMTSIWRIVFLDKLDHGTRLDEMLKGLQKNSFDDEPNARLFASTCSLSFMRHLVNSVIFQNSLTSYGRCELYLCVNPILFMHLTCAGDAGYMLYRATSVLFQILFEHEFICKLNRKDFLPWQTDTKKSSYAKLGKFNIVDPEYVYFIKAVPRRNLHSFVLPENLPALWFFVKQHFMSRKNRVVPTLERWIPKCGPRLIVNKNKIVSPSLLDPQTEVSELPQFSTPSKTLTNEDFIQDMDIYTEFGDLTPSQVLTLFNQFISWPEYKECSFGASLETTLMKLHTSPVDSLELNEDEEDTKAAKIVEK